MMLTLTLTYIPLNKITLEIHWWENGSPAVADSDLKAVEAELRAHGSRRPMSLQALCKNHVLVLLVQSIMLESGNLQKLHF